MIKSDNELFRNQNASNEFIFCKTDSSYPKGDKEKTTVACIESLRATFPNLRFGTDFIDSFLENYDMEKFGAMAIKIDNNKREDMLLLCTDIAKIIDKVCRIKEGKWGLLDESVFGAFFPGKDEKECEKIAGKIKDELASVMKETLSIGISAFPILDYKKNKIMDNAIKALEHAFFFGPDSTVTFDAVTLNISGDKLYEQKRIKKAIAEFESALKLEPENINVLNSLGVCYGVERNFGKALRIFNEIKRLKPEYSMAIYNSGVANLLTKKKKKALACFFEIYDNEKPNKFEAGLQIAKLYIEEKEPEKAKPYLEEMLKMKPESGHAHRLFGDYYQANGKIEDAIKSYKDAIKYNPYDSASLSALGYLFDKQGENIEIAISFCKQSVINSSGNGLFRHRLGKLYLKNNMRKEAHIEFIYADKAGYDSSEYIAKLEKEI